MVGAGVYEMKEIPHGDNMYGWGPTLLATVVSFVVGYAAIAWLLKFVSHHTLTPFVVYRVLLGARCDRPARGRRAGVIAA